MIVHRLEFTVKAGRSVDAIEWFKWDRKRIGSNHRIYYNRMGSGHRIAVEAEFENLGELEKWWAEYTANLASVSDPPVNFHEAIENFYSKEVWDLIE